MTADRLFTQEEISSFMNALTLNTWSFMNALNTWANSLPENQQALLRRFLPSGGESRELCTEALDDETFEGLATQLAEFANGCDPRHQLSVMFLVRRLRDPIERLKLRSPIGQFSEEEETILQDLERETGRP